MKTLVERYESAAVRRPWVVALAPAITGGLVVGAIRLASGYPHGFLNAAIPITIAAWVILGSLYRLNARL